MKWSAFSLMALLSSSHLLADVAQEGAVAGFHLDNDFFIGVDNNYTNGTQFSWMSGTTTNPDSFAARIGTIFGGTNASYSWRSFMGMKHSPHLRQQWGVNLTQIICTPETKSTQPLYDQHPYAGSLTLGLSSLVKNEDRANSFELQVGATGRPSLAKGSQHFIHKLWGMEQWPGWATQLPSEAVANVYFRRYYRLRCLETHNMSGWETDSLVYWHADAGTLRVQAGTGFSFRFGFNLGNTSPENSLRGAVSDAAPFVYNRTSSISDWGYYFYLNGSVRVVAYDYYLDGPVFHDSPKYVDKYPVVAEWAYGFGVMYKNAQFIFGFHYATKEYKKQMNIDAIGSLQIRYTF